MTRPQIPWPRIAAEGVVIVVSILLAFGIDAWWADRQIRGEEVRVLVQLAEGLRVDREEFGSRLERQQAVEQDVLALASDLSDGPESSELLQRRIGSLHTWVGVSPNTAPYEALKSSGLDLVSSEDLRVALIRYYEGRLPALVNAYENDRDFVQEMAAPYAHSHFRQNRDGSWDPLDLTELMADQYFANLLETKLQRLRLYILPLYTLALSDIEALLEAIEAELALR